MTVGRARAILIRYRSAQTDPAEKSRAENRVRDALRVALGADVTVTFEELRGEEPWRRSSVRILGHWTRSRADIYREVSVCLSGAEATPSLDYPSVPRSA